MEASDAEFLYLYGRAKLLTGDNEEAVKALKLPLRASLDSPQAKRHAQEEATLGLATVALKSDRTGRRAVVTK